MNRIRPLVALAAATLTAALAVASAGAAPADWSATTLAQGLDSPRGLVFAPNGTLYVAEAGHGGDVCQDSPIGRDCVGTSSRISKVDTTSGAVTPVVSGLYSRSLGMEGITGVDGLAARGGELFGAITLYPQELEQRGCDGQPADCAQTMATARAQAGQLISFTPSGSWKAIAGVGRTDFDWTKSNPSYSTEPSNANPYGVATVSNGVYVADAGANTLDFVGANGDVTIASAMKPPAPGGFPADTVPTCVAVLRGNLYAGTLSGHLYERKGSFTPSEVTLSGAQLHHVTGCVADEKSGSLYLVDMWGTPGPPIPAGPGSTAGTGSVIELAKDGQATTIAHGLDFPNGIALGPDGSLYVSVGSTCTATGTPFPYCAHGGSIVRLRHP